MSVKLKSALLIGATVTALVGCGNPSDNKTQAPAGEKAVANAHWSSPPKPPTPHLTT